RLAGPQGRAFQHGEGGMATAPNPSGEPLEMGNGGANPVDVFDVRKVRRFVELMKEHDLAEIDLRDGERRIRLRADQEPPTAFAPLSPVASPRVPDPAATDAPPESAANTEPKGEPANVAYVTSPMVGTFYTAANPDAAPYVKVGDQIGPESIVCIIEAMKVFNEIPAECGGRIAAVLAESGDAIEYGQKLFKVEKLA
ncbi:MAG: acetyl-CoA carboxylase biotin carboxyl carrier protein, partial [Planctomycetota bacterium]